MIIKILLELIKVLQIMYDIIIDRVGIDQSKKDELIDSFANLKEFVGQFDKDTPHG